MNTYEDEINKTIIPTVLEKLRNYNSIPNLKLNKHSVSKESFIKLLKSNNEDHNLIALYLIQFLQQDIIDYQQINSNEHCAKLFARYHLAEIWDGELSCEQMRDKINCYPILKNCSGIAKHYYALCKELPNATSSSGRLLSPNTQNSMTILVHGTWAATCRWWKKQSSFWSYINSITNDLYKGNSPFYWSGSNSHKAREDAAALLLQWTNKNPSKKLNIIAHSHGGNICLLASQQGVKINKLILLGTPIRCEYLPKLKNINSIYNIFSIIDLTQLVGTFPNCRFEGRTLGDSQKVINLRANDNGNGHDPKHSELYSKNTWAASELNKLF